MENSADNSNNQYQLENIQNVLIDQLEEARQQSPESFSKLIYASPAINNNDEYQLGQYLEQERKDHNGKRTILIPYSLANSYWIGILIEFEADEHIIRAEYIDPVNGSDVIPDRIQKQFSKTYPFAVLCSRDLLKHHDKNLSAVLTTKNLLEAVKYKPCPDLINSTPLQSKTIVRDECKTMTYSIEKSSLNCPKEDRTIATSTVRNSNEGKANAQEIVSFASSLYPESKLLELKKTLNNGLESIKLSNADELLGEIKDTEEQIQIFQGHQRHKEAEKEMAFLRKLQELKELSDKITETTLNAFVSSTDRKSELHELSKNLNSGLAKLNLQNTDDLPERIKDTKERIKRLERRGRQAEVQEEIEFLHELQELKDLSDKVNELNSTVAGFPHRALDSDVDRHIIQNETEPISTSVSLTHVIHEASTQWSQLEPLPGTDIMTLVEQKKKYLRIEELLDEADLMPISAGKTIIELLVYFEQRLLGEYAPLKNEDTPLSSLKKLQDQLKKEESFSENTRAILQDLETYISRDNYSFTVRCLNELLKKIRPLSAREIQRLVLKANKAANSIRDKEIILLVGVTGSGKSTTIQFLAGATMKELRVEISSGKFVKHITAVGLLKDTELSNINSSYLQKSETRFIAPVTVELNKVLDAHETGTLILCDAPGFGDTAGPEVDIANSIGVIEALKGTKSVKLLALSSYKSLGDRGEGIQELARILVSMIHGIEDKLDAIVYGFTKYPEDIDPNAELVNIKTSKVNEDAALQYDTAFVTVLNDMIDKTDNDAFKIEPTSNIPKKLIRKLKRVPGIKNPEEVFRFL
ncbi:unnamed protein product [Rotaria magnacalcarata]|uniref:Uncharacterized protein n=1 Tax=Rotaria magnacalcarata TaxID=392030 RepID=A0A815WAY1_9BILA|nr:unnamed protein product [Rotaria magnacalcarata]CAF1539698.1 unnamed protein product [Rotaria magnacalcarata]CAF3874279.1 unnamed protein product [Rotaria magnacalcarata]CAF3898405.1 unnamed protein product [Rotaria magnacalcarata]